MSLVHKSFACALVITLTSVGCHVPVRRSSSPPNPLASNSAHELHESDESSVQPHSFDLVRPAAFQAPDTQPPEEVPPSPAIDELGELTLESFIDEVLMIHPSVEAMVAAWQAAADRYPQVVSLDDPMFNAMFAPSTFNSPIVESAYALELSQKFPWLGKRRLRGAVAGAEAESAAGDIETTRQKLSETAAQAFWEYYLIKRQLELNHESSTILQSFRTNAQNRYQTGLVTSQDVLQADIEIANLEQRSIELQRMDRVAAGRINVLLRRNPTDPLPPPQKSMESEFQLSDLDPVLAFAVNQRPELAAADARVRAAEATLALTYKDFYPDTELYGRYDTFWQPADTQSELRSQVGVRLNVPIYRGRLNAAVCAARHQLARARAEFDQLFLEVQSDVQMAYEQVRESQRTLTLYSDKLLPAAEQNVAAARANYDTAKINFLDLATAQRQLVDARERQILAQVELERRVATLRRVTGGILLEEAN